MVYDRREHLVRGNKPETILVARAAKYNSNHISWAVFVPGADSPLVESGSPFVMFGAFPPAGFYARYLRAFDERTAFIVRS